MSTHQRLDDITVKVKEIRQLTGVRWERMMICEWSKIQFLENIFRAHRLVSNIFAVRFIGGIKIPISARSRIKETMEEINLCLFWIFIQNPWFFATLSPQRLYILKCRLRRYLNVYFRWVWKVSLDAFVFCENTFCVEIKAEYILKQTETHLAF